MKLKEYEVLYAERSKNAVYVCRRPFESKLYRIIESTDKKKIEKYIKYFVIRKPRGFCEGFCLDEKYYAVFCAPDGIPLKSTEETLSVRRVIRALAMQAPPPEIAVRMLSREHIFVCGDELEFAYELPETAHGITREFFFERLADFVDISCDADAEGVSESWLTDLRGGKFDDLVSAYRSMPNIAEKAEAPEGERFKVLRSVLPKLIAAAVLAAAIIGAAIALSEQSGEDTVYSRIDSIGTIDLTKKE